MKLIFKQTFEYVSTYNRPTKGWEFIDIAEDEQDFYHKIERIEDSDFFAIGDDGRVTDQMGNEVYDPDYPDLFDYQDYHYRLLSLHDLDEQHFECLRKSPRGTILIVLEELMAARFGGKE